MIEAGLGMLFWHWWVLGFALIVVEVLTPGTFCFWVGLAAFATGAIAWAFPALALPAQIVLFALLSLAAVALWFRLRPLRTPNADDNGLNQRGRRYVGRVLVLSEAIVNGIGQVRLEDTVWRVAGPDLPRGSRVRVIGSEGATLRVEAVSEQAH